MFYVRKVIIVCFVYLQYTDKTVYCKCKGVVNYMWNTFDNCKQQLIEMNHFGDYKNGMSGVQLKEKTEVLIEKYKSISVSRAKSEIIAFILKNATERSFILLDEIGRGTSTYDGVAIAWAVAEYLATKIKARSIFATHYHELNVMSLTYPQIKNYRITVTENEDGIEFLRKVVEGSASKSYGIHVAKMAGLPSVVVDSAQKLMVKLQKDCSKDLSKNRRTTSANIEVPQLTLNLTDL